MWPQQSGLLPSVSVKSYASASWRALTIVPAQRSASSASSERGYTSGHVGRRLGDPEARALLHGVAPVCLGDTEVLQHLLGAQPARCDADGRHGEATQFGVEPLHDPLDIRLDEVVVETDVAPELRIRVRRAVRHLDHQTAGPLIVSASSASAGSPPGR